MKVKPVAMLSHFVTSDTVIMLVWSVTWVPFLTELVTQVDGWNNKIKAILKALLFITVKFTEKFKYTTNIITVYNPKLEVFPKNTMFA